MSLFSSSWAVGESLSSPNADGGSYAAHGSQASSLSSEGESFPSSPTGHYWEMNYQEAAIYLQVSISGPGLGPSTGERGGGGALLDAQEFSSSFSSLCLSFSHLMVGRASLMVPALDGRCTWAHQVTPACGSTCPTSLPELKATHLVGCRVWVGGHTSLQVMFFLLYIVTSFLYATTCMNLKMSHVVVGKEVTK